MAGKLRRDAFSRRAALVGVVLVDASEDLPGMPNPIAVGQGGHVEVIPDLVAPDDQVALDSQGLLRSRYPWPSAMPLDPGDSHQPKLGMAAPWQP